MPMTIKAMTTETLINTMMLFTVANSETPKTSNAVTASSATTAGRLKRPVPPVGAPVIASVTGTP